MRLLNSTHPIAILMSHLIDPLHSYTILTAKLQQKGILHLEGHLFCMFMESD